MSELDEKITNAELRQIIDSHEKGHCMVIRTNADYRMAKELLAVREANGEPVAQIEVISGVLVNDRWMHQRLPNGWHDLFAAPPAPAVPTPVTFCESADADKCRTLAWERVQEMVTTDGWQLGDKENYFGFFCWGWDMRRQYNEQRAPAVPDEVAAALDWIDDFIARCNGDDRGSNASVNLLRAAMLQPVSQGYTLNSPVIPDGCSAKSPYAAAAVPTDQLINIANHIAGSAGALPDEWQDWASELVSDLRRLAASKVDPVVPGDAEFNAWVHGDYNRGVTLSCPVNLGIARSAWKGCCAAMLATVPDEIDIFVDQVCGNLPAGHQQ